MSRRKAGGAPLPHDGMGAFTAADLRALLDRIGRELEDDQGREGDALRAEIAAEYCRQVETDREAEFVRRGVELGLALAAFNRKIYHADVSTRAGGRGGRRESVTDEQIRDALELHQTRQDQAAHLGISVRQLRERLSKLQAKDRQ